MKRFIKSSALIFVSFLVLIIILKEPITFSQSIKNGFMLFLVNYAPSCFPFLFISKLLSMSIRNFNLLPLNKVYGVSNKAGTIVLLSLISGYPNNAKLISDLYTCGQINKNQAKTLLSFTSISSPIFVVYTVGYAYLNSIHLGYILFISIVFASLINGLIYRRKDDNIYCIDTSNQNGNILLESMKDSFLSLLVIGGYICLFYLIVDILIYLRILNDNPFILSLIELTRGLSLLKHYNDKTKILPIVAGLISFGGLSIGAQSLAFIHPTGIKLGFYLLTKLTQSIISIIICYLLLLI